MDILEVLQYPWAARALAAACMVGILCGTLGVFIVLRNMSLIGDALAHAILPGIVVAFILVGYSTIGFFIGAVAAGLLTAVAITWIQHSSNTKNDAAIGIAFTAMFAIGVIGISRISRDQGVHLDLKDFLFGNILGVSNEDLWLTGPVTIFTLIAVTLFYRHLFATTFQATIARTMGISVQTVHYFLMLLLSFAVVAALRTVGVILVVAMLITPAATALLIARRLPAVLLLSAGTGLVTAVLGFILSVAFETTPGPAMTIVATGFYVLALILAPEKGLLARLIRKRALRRKIMEEDILKIAKKAGLSTDSWVLQLNLSGGKMKRYTQLLIKKGLLHKQGDQWELTPAGEARANEIIRAHRLWETYLVELAGMQEAHIHDDAEVQEHLLGDDVLDEIEAMLGFPKKDPHGSPIPQKEGKKTTTLWDLPTGEILNSGDQHSWKMGVQQCLALGLDPMLPMTITERSSGSIALAQDERWINLSKEEASMIRIGRDHSSSSGEPI